MERERRQQQNMVEEGQPLPSENAEEGMPPSEAPRDRSRDRPVGRHNGRRGRGGRGGKRKGKNSIPDNWEDVAKMGGLVRDSRFVPMRCPLDDKFTPLYKTPDDAWSPQMFVQEQEIRGHNIRMVIDLTNTFKYYDGSTVFEGTPIEYVKLKIEGFNAPPREDEVVKFIEIVDAFVEKEPTGNIAVHCTHGLNRTGYMIVSYLVKKQGCAVKHALESFTLARPPGLIKHMYVEALYRNLGAGEEVELPVLPEWAAEKYSKRH
jgi:mRNA-capping enzyme